jgi:glycosyltransferase involved in cell wall biosynthesis
MSPDENFTSIRCIDSVNPLSWFNTGKKLVKEKYDMVIFRYWNPFFAPALGTIASVLKRKAPQSKLISLCDNILPHEYIPMGNFFTEYFLNKMDGHLVQSSQTEEELNQIISNPCYVKRLHPLYDNFPEKIDKKFAKEKLGISSKYVILYFGLIRQYKGFDILLNAVSELLTLRSDFHVLAAGECYGDDSPYKKIIKEKNLQQVLTWENRFIPDDEVADYFSAADIAALPYRSASQSGITQIAFHYDVPVIVTSVGGLPEIVPDGEVGRVIETENPHMLTETLNQCLTEKNLEEMSQNIVEHKKQFSWDHFIDGIEEVYSQII